MEDREISLSLCIYFEVTYLCNILREFDWMESWVKFLEKSENIQVTKMKSVFKVVHLII